MDRREASYDISTSVGEAWTMRSRATCRNVGTPGWAPGRTPNRQCAPRAVYTGPPTRSAPVRRSRAVTHGAPRIAPRRAPASVGLRPIYPIHTTATAARPATVSARLVFLDLDVVHTITSPSKHAALHAPRERAWLAHHFSSVGVVRLASPSAALDAGFTRSNTTACAQLSTAAVRLGSRVERARGGRIRRCARSTSAAAPPL